MKNLLRGTTESKGNSPWDSSQRACGAPSPCKMEAVKGSARHGVEFLVEGAPRRIEIASLVIAGWTGRDKAAVEHHIAELAAIGVKRPRAIPCFYRLGANLLNATGEVEVGGEGTSGEVGCVACSGAGALVEGLVATPTHRT